MKDLNYIRKNLSNYLHNPEEDVMIFNNVDDVIDINEEFGNVFTFSSYQVLSAKYEKWA